VETVSEPDVDTIVGRLREACGASRGGPRKD
jgi:hypothetical protein